MTLSLHKTAIIITLITCLIPTFSHAKYRAYNLKNHPQVVQGKKFIDIKINMRLEDNSIIRLAPNDRLTVRLSSFNGPVYQFTKPTPAKGTTLKKLIEEKEKEQISTVQTVNKTIANGLSNHTPAKDAFDRAGVSHIATNSQGSITTLRYLLGPEEIKPDDLPAAMVDVTRRTDPDQLYHFIFKSLKHNILYVNMLRKDSDPENIKLLFPEAILITTTDREMDGFLFPMPEKYDPGMILIISDQPFNIADVKNELNVATQNINRNYSYQIIR